MFWSRVFAISFDDRISIVIIIILKISAMGIIPSTIFLLFLVFSETSFDIAIGSDRVAMVMKRVYVGIISMYSPIPSTPIILVVIILIIIPSIFVINPPIIRIIVDFINFSFIVNCMFFILIFLK